MRKHNSRQLNLALHGANCCLETDHIPFFSYAHRYLTNLSVGEATPDVFVRLHWDAAPSQSWRNGSVRRWGRRILQANQRILQTEILYLPGLQLEAKWSNGKLMIEAYYRPTSRRERLAHWLGREIAPLFVMLIYSLVYFPLINYLEQTRGWRLLHAGAISSPAGAWVLAGLPGSGKSTFTFSALANPQARLLSDNLLLFDAERVYALPEPIRLSLASRALLPPAAKNRLVDTGRDFSHGRREFCLPPEARDRQTKPQALSFLGLTGGRVDCQPLSTSVALNRLLTFDQMAKEVNFYTQFAASLNLIAPSHGQTQHHLSTTKPCYPIYRDGQKA